MLTIATTYQPATDLGYLLHKHPDRMQSFKTAYGQAHVFYPEAGAERCVAALMLEVDVVALTSRNRKAQPEALQDYVNDRAYSANSHLSSAISEVFRSALNGRCNDRPELVHTPLPLEARITAVRARNAADIIPRLFEHLGYTVAAETLAHDPAFPEWGDSQYCNLTLSSDCNTLQALLQHLYVLLPTMDNNKHYRLNEDEVDKLTRSASDWLPGHPERDLITRRYLGYRRNLSQQAAATMFGDDDDEETEPANPATPDIEPEHSVPLGQQRIDAVMARIRQSGPSSVLDLGCGEGRLLLELMKQDTPARVAGVETAPVSLSRAERRLRTDRMTPDRKARLTLLHGSLTYRDDRLQGYDAAAAVEVIEHIDPSKLDAFADAVLGYANPGVLILTTPNVEYNARFPDWTPGKMRHRDHRFEWTRAEFREWCERQAREYGYTAEYQDVGEPDPELGPPTQMAVLTRAGRE